MERDRDDTTHLQPRALAALLVRKVTLRVVQGPDQGLAVRVEQPSFTIGSGPEADLRLGDPAISRTHLTLGLAPGGVELHDPSSTNGTWIHGQQVRDALLVSDTSISLGSTLLQLTLDASQDTLAVSPLDHFGSALGASLSMRHVFELLERASTSEIGILLEGESGVGKEILAREVHTHSPRAAGTFLVFDCGAVAPNLIESELFGHARGAFTGAVESRQGVFERASGGTLFLDEVGELDLALQPKLLRALEQREVTPVGGSAPIRVDVRVVAATNRRLSEGVRKGEFRADLFYRLAVARITVPPLRDRRDDILPIARSFLRQALGNAEAQLPPDLEGLLLAYAWPGNVRELRNVIQRFAFLGARDPASLFDASVVAEEPLLPYDIARQRAIEDFEARYVPAVLARAGGTAAKAAQLAGVARQSFYRMIQRVRGGRPEGEES